MKPQSVQILSFVAVAMLFGASLGALRQLHRLKQESGNNHRAEREVLYLPSGPGLELLSFGYRNALSNLLWFRTISYFGEHYASDRNYRWLNHMCSLVTRLTPKAFHAYQFCSNMLSWEANSPADSIKLLSRGIEHSPDDWRLYYFRGITFLYFLKGSQHARDDFVAASKLKDSPVFIKRLAAKTLAELESPSAAISLLETLVANERDTSAKKALTERLRELEHAQGGKQ